MFFSEKMKKKRQQHGNNTLWAMIQRELYLKRLRLVLSSIPWRFVASEKKRPSSEVAGRDVFTIILIVLCRLCLNGRTHWPMIVVIGWCRPICTLFPVVSCVCLVPVPSKRSHALAPVSLVRACTTSAQKPGGANFVCAVHPILCSHFFIFHA